MVLRLQKAKVGSGDRLQRPKQALLVDIDP